LRTKGRIPLPKLKKGLWFGVIYKGVVPFLLSFIVVAALLFIFPEIATYLPYALMGK
jgi:TRAP-type mannitol/chloroaromatic compound transport system permease large subunit